MNNLINDPAFGSMEFNYGWCKENEITFFGKTYAVETLVDAEAGQPISDAQRSFYKTFCSEINELSTTALNELWCFYTENLPCISAQVTAPLPQEEELTDADLIGMVVPKTVFFPQDNFYAILCDCIWEPINGLAFIIDSEGISIGTQNTVL